MKTPHILLFCFLCLFLTAAGSFGATLAELVEATPAGGVLYLPDGQGFTNEYVTLEKDITIIGGSGGTVLMQSGFVVPEGLTVTLSNLRLISGRIWSSATLTVNDCEFNSSPLYVGGTYHLTANRCTSSGPWIKEEIVGSIVSFVYNPDRRVEIYDSTCDNYFCNISGDLLVENCVVKGKGGTLSYCIAAGRAELKNVHVDLYGKSTIFTFYAVSDFVAENCTFKIEETFWTEGWDGTIFRSLNDKMLFANCFFYYNSHAMFEELSGSREGEYTDASMLIALEGVYAVNCIFAGPEYETQGFEKVYYCITPGGPDFAKNIYYRNASAYEKIFAGLSLQNNVFNIPKNRYTSGTGTRTGRDAAGNIVYMHEGEWLRLIGGEPDGAVTETTVDMLGNTRLPQFPCMGPYQTVLPVCWIGNSDPDNAATTHYVTLQEGLAAVENGGTLYLHDLTLRVTDTLVINKNISIVGSAYTVLDGAGTTRIMEIGAGSTVALRNIRFLDGNGSVGGGAILNNGTLNIMDCTFDDNSGSYLGFLGKGGAIYNAGGTLTIGNSTFLRNSAGLGAGALCNEGGTVVIHDSTMVNNGTFEIFNQGGVMTVLNSIIMNESQSFTVSADGMLNIAYTAYNYVNLSAGAVLNDGGNNFTNATVTHVFGTPAPGLNADERTIAVSPLGIAVRYGGPTGIHNNRYCFQSDSIWRYFDANGVPQALGSAPATIFSTTQDGASRTPYVLLHGTLGACASGRFGDHALHVTTTNDVTIAGDGQVSLREALAYAYLLNGTVPDITAPEITFADGLGVIGIDGEMILDFAVDITGNGAENTIIDARRRGRVFDVIYLHTLRKPEVNISGMTLENGISSGNGGAVNSVENSNVVLSNCVLRGNSATSAASYGGAVHGGTLNACVLTGNTATYAGGAAGRSVLNDCIITENTAQYGGGASDCPLNRCRVLNNTAERGGGLNYCKATNTLIAGNTATVDGGAMRNGTTNNAIVNCTITGNTAPANKTGGVWASGSSAFTVKNSIVWNNSGSNYSTNISFTYSCTAPEISGTGNISDDPLFVNSAINDYRLRPGSPCLNAGSAEGIDSGALDLLGNPLVSAGAVNIGAYAGTGVAAETSHRVPYGWFEQYLLVSPDSDHYVYELAAEDTARKDYPVWHDYVAGTDPTNLNDYFTVFFTNGLQIGWTPDISASGRIYKVFGKASLTDTNEWNETDPANHTSNRFFHVTVELEK